MKDTWKIEKMRFFALYDNAGVSPFIGFEPDTENLNNISNDLSDFMNGLMVSRWRRV